MTLINHFTVNSATVNTTDATTATTIHTWTPGSHTPVVDNCIVVVEGTLIGKQSSNGVSIKASATFLISSGTVSLLGSQTSIVASEGSAALTSSTITLDTSSNIIRIRANGVAATTIAWNGWLDIRTSTF